MKEVDLGDPSDIPDLDGEKCWEYFDEIIIYKIDDYVLNFINIPFDKAKKKFLWTPDTIPVASNGKIKDW